MGAVTLEGATCYRSQSGALLAAAAIETQDLPKRRTYGDPGCSGVVGAAMLATERGRSQTP